MPKLLPLLYQKSRYKDDSSTMQSLYVLTLVCACVRQCSTRVIITVVPPLIAVEETGNSGVAREPLMYVD